MIITRLDSDIRVYSTEFMVPNSGIPVGKPKTAFSSLNSRWSLGKYIAKSVNLLCGFPKGMGKTEPSDEDIRKWIKEGWKFTKRPRKGHVYITRRMGANIERSLGRFKQSLWERIEKISKEPDKQQRETDPLTTFYMLLELLRSNRNSIDCLHKDDEEYCTYWRWNNDLPFLRYGENLPMKEVIDEGNPVCLIFAHGNYCRGCTAYISEKMKASKS